MASGASEDGELGAGHVCAGYKIVSLIAAGGMGDVYEAVHLPSGKTVAFKCLKVRHRDKEDARARMKMEAVVLSELRHANVVQVYDAGVTEVGTVWIAMERLHGQTLRELLHRAGRVSIPDALYFASEVADGVRAVHDASVIHRDLKPENIFITDRKLVKVLDLGTGKFLGYGLKSTDGGRVLGTTAYMAPEQIRGMRVDARADVYALGLIVYEMIAGHHALAEGLSELPRAIEQVALRQLETTPRPLAEMAHGCPLYLSSLVEKAMAKDRDQRHPNMTALSADLRAARKRFIAENRLDESSIDLRARSEGLREKLGAPRRTPVPPPETVAPQAAPIRAAWPPESDSDLMKTERRGPPDFTVDGSAPRSVREATIEFSASSLSSPAPGAANVGVPRDSKPSREVANLPTRTNPLVVALPSDFTPEPLALPEGRRTFAGGWGRRLALTLGLGALIGVPPALLGVYGWTAHRRESSSTDEVAPSPTVPVGIPLLPASTEMNGAQKAAAAADSTMVATESPHAAEQGARVAESVTHATEPGAHAAGATPSSLVQALRPRAPRSPAAPHVAPPRTPTIAVPSSAAEAPDPAPRALPSSGL